MHVAWAVMSGTRISVKDVQEHEGIHGGNIGFVNNLGMDLA